MWRWSDPDTLAGWGTIRTSVAETVAVPRDRVLALFLDYPQWPRIFSRRSRERRAAEGAHGAKR
jgi:hypothetical protein